MIPLRRLLTGGSSIKAHTHQTKDTLLQLYCRKTLERLQLLQNPRLSGTLPYPTHVPVVLTDAGWLAHEAV